ncbi:hypothetical protein OIDMADRAFT_21501 [Oidiodendron maius Zn]|uniref:Uncharacterized protein n=1 Tax=Oidiodendron maius (strain Zn) TaxID=913774 RepID=A0A0C3GSU4_OIDMZ|nr:hypothetical protein OIDMADRAFT_21501 [Oidiodendron maius Zn]
MSFATIRSRKNIDVEEANLRVGISGGLKVHIGETLDAPSVRHFCAYRTETEEFILSFFFSDLYLSFIQRIGGGNADSWRTCLFSNTR